MKYPIGIQSFESLRKENYVYVDKTEMVYELAERGKYYFLSRPRRLARVCSFPRLKPISQDGRICLKAW